MVRVLLVEDDPVIAKIIHYYLSECKEYEIKWAQNASQAIELCGANTDVILLDIMLPDINGIDLCARLRRKIYCPIIFISCLDDEETIVRALETGGDDYLTKPFNTRVLQARIQANLRRVQIERAERPQQVSFRDFSVDTASHSLTRKNESIPLAPIEFGILMYLLNHPNRIVTPDELYEAVWDKPSYGDVRTVIVHVYNLRKKLEPNPARPQYIKNVRGKGYNFDPSGTPERSV